MGGTSPPASISRAAPGLATILDADVVGNTELELTPAEARRVARLLVEAAERADGGPSD